MKVQKNCGPPHQPIGRTRTFPVERSNFVNSRGGFRQSPHILPYPLVLQLFPRLAINNLSSSDSALFVPATVALIGALAAHKPPYPFGRRPVSLLRGPIRRFRSPSGNG